MKWAKQSVMWQRRGVFCLSVVLGALLVFSPLLAGNGEDWLMGEPNTEDTPVSDSLVLNSPTSQRWDSIKSTFDRLERGEVDALPQASELIRWAYDQQSYGAKCLVPHPIYSGSYMRLLHYQLARLQRIYGQGEARINGEAAGMAATWLAQPEKEIVDGFVFLPSGNPDIYRWYDHKAEALFEKDRLLEARFLWEVLFRFSPRSEEERDYLQERVDACNAPYKRLIKRGLPFEDRIADLLYPGVDYWNGWFQVLSDYVESERLGYVLISDVRRNLYLFVYDPKADKILKKVFVARRGIPWLYPILGEGPYYLKTNSVGLSVRSERMSALLSFDGQAISISDFDDISNEQYRDFFWSRLRKSYRDIYAFRQGKADFQKLDGAAVRDAIFQEPIVDVKKGLLHHLLATSPTFEADLKTYLGHSKPLYRRLALEYLSKKGGCDQLQPLIDHFSNELDLGTLLFWVDAIEGIDRRLDCAYRLGSLVLAPFHNEPYIRRYAVRLLSVLDRQNIYNYILVALKDTVRIVRFEAITIAMESALPNSLKSQIYKRGIEDPDAWIRALTLSGIARLGNDACSFSERVLAIAQAEGSSRDERHRALHILKSLDLNMIEEEALKKRISSLLALTKF